MSSRELGQAIVTERYSAKKKKRKGKKKKVTKKV